MLFLQLQRLLENNFPLDPLSISDSDSDSDSAPIIRTIAVKDLYPFKFESLAGYQLPDVTLECGQGA